MSEIRVDFSENIGKIKPMHAVNNGPVYKFAPDQRISNLEDYRAAGIPYARTHDASFYSGYGGEHIVDVHAIFPNFDADAYDESSYDFALTDDYLKIIQLAGTKPFYRLGSKIEHWRKKYGTLPPKDFNKWAVICEHIIKHYNYGWADGFEMGIEYWEIWNEPDLDPDDSEHKRTWGGTKLQFFELYNITSAHLKKCFPKLKIGGPGLAFRFDWAEEFLSQLKTPIDFFSWHMYAKDPKQISEKACFVRELLDRNGCEKTESILNEWNYVKGWQGDDWLYSLRNEKGIKGASFIAGAMCESQRTPIDILMYYDARPCPMNGMFDTDFVCDKLKGYYPFYAFNCLYKLGNSVKACSDDDRIYICAAKGKASYAIFTTYYDNDDSAPEKSAELCISGLESSKKYKLEYYLLDSGHDLERVKEEIVSGNVSLKIDFKLFSAYLIKIESV